MAILNTNTSDALRKALLEEYLTLNTYKAIRSELSKNNLDTQVFDSIIQLEQQHVTTLRSTMNKYKVSTISIGNTKVDQTNLPQTLKDAYELGKTLETTDANLYDDLLVKSTNSSIDQVFTKLQSESLENHYVVFDNALSQFNTSTNSTEEALKEALAEEYLALDTYTAVRESLANNQLATKIFDNILKAEQQHVDMLKQSMQIYNIDTNDIQRTEINLDTIPTTLKDAYELGKALELADGHLYDELLIQSTADDVDQVFTKLQSASLDKHYVAFDNALSQLIGIDANISLI